MSTAFTNARSILALVDAALAEERATVRLVGRQVHLHCEPSLLAELGPTTEDPQAGLLELTTAIQAEIDGGDESAQFLLGKPGSESDARLAAWRALREEVGKTLVGTELRREATYRRSVERDGFRDIRWSLGERTLRDQEGERYGHAYALLSLHRYGSHRESPFPWNQFLGDAAQPDPHVLEVDAADVARLIQALEEVKASLKIDSGAADS